MDRNRISVGLIGCGWIAELVHMPNLKAHPGVSVKAVADRSEERRAVAARAFPQAARYPDARALLADPEIDAVVLALPPAANRPVLEAVLAAGKDIYVEKPLAPTAADGEAIVAAWRGSGRIAMLGYNFRYSPVVEDAERQVRAGVLGEVVAVQGRFTWAVPRLEDWRGDPGGGGGALLELASHHIDLFGALTGQSLVGATARERSLRHRGDTVDLMFEGDGGASLQLHVCFAAGANANRLSVLGAKGQLDVDLLDVRPRRPDHSVTDVGRLERLRRAMDGLHPADILRTPGFEPSFGRALDAFVRACRDRTQPAPDPAAGLSVLRAVEAARASIVRGGAPVAIEGATRLQRDAG